jgi:anti-sigma factor RsiW
MSRSEHVAVQELLPWLVNGTLGPAEQEAVRRHLDECGECRLEAERCRHLAAELERTSVPAPAPHPAQLARLEERIARGDLDREEPLAPARLPVPAGRRTPRFARWLIGVEAAALVVCLSWIASSGGTPGPLPSAATFHTLSSPSANRTASVRVVFAPDATESEIRGLLLEVRAEIVSGPSALGAYGLALAPTAAGESREDVIARLRAHPKVRLAEPILGGEDAAR